MNLLLPIPASIQATASGSMTISLSAVGAFPEPDGALEELGPGASSSFSSFFSATESQSLISSERFQSDEITKLLFQIVIHPLVFLGPFSHFESFVEFQRWGSLIGM